MIESLLFIGIGVLCLYFGAEYLVHGSASFALRMGIPPLAVGLIIVGYGTGVPELIVSVNASILGKGDIAVGNVIGSNIANIGLVLGFSSLLRPVEVHKRVIEVDGIILVVVSAICSVLLLQGYLGPFHGMFLLAALLGYTIWAIYSGWKENHVEVFAVEEEVGKVTQSFAIDFVMMFGGTIALIIGGRFFLSGAIALAKIWGISDAVIGLTIVALGTSLPEFATSMVAIIRRHGDIAMGNIIGSSIFNLLGILGCASLIHPIQIRGIQWLDFVVMTGLAILLVPMSASGRIRRIEGGLLVMVYLGYIVYLVNS